MQASCFYCNEQFEIEDLETAITLYCFVFCEENCKLNFRCYLSQCSIEQGNNFFLKNGINPNVLLGLK
jgi:hypothetical protein